MCDVDDVEEVVRDVVESQVAGIRVDRFAIECAGHVRVHVLLVILGVDRGAAVDVVTRQPNPWEHWPVVSEEDSVRDCRPVALKVKVLPSLIGT